ncbi:hypothetical protein F2981_06255 [Sinorhizobium meliloti]|nr:hypothetical protein [Sinorhizobium meliloti]
MPTPEASLHRASSNAAAGGGYSRISKTCSAAQMPAPNGRVTIASTSGAMLSAEDLLPGRSGKGGILML